MEMDEEKLMVGMNAVNSNEGLWNQMAISVSQNNLRHT